MSDLTERLNDLRERVDSAYGTHRNRDMNTLAGAVNTLTELEAENARLREALGSCLWVLNNRHNAGTPQFEEYAQAAEADARAALSDQQEGSDG